MENIEKKEASEKSKEAPKPSKRLAYVDALNVIAALCVVMLHCNGCFWLGPAQGRSWVSANVIETTLYWPVPVFFMITGATLMGYRSRMSTSQYFRRRFGRTVIPFVAWSTIGLVWAVAKASMDGVPMNLSVTGVIDGILNTRYTGVYWFFIPLFAVYLSMPILSLLIDHTKVLRYIVVAGMLFVFTLPLLCKLLEIQWNQALAPPPVMGYVAYVVIGYLLSTQELEKRHRVIIYVLGVVGWAVQLFGTFALSSVDGGINAIFKGYTNLPALLQSVAVFTFVCYVDFGANAGLTRLSGFCKFLSGATFGVYLMHWYCIDIVGRMGVINTLSIWWRIFGAVAIFAVCALLTLAIKRTPVLRRLVP